MIKPNKFIQRLFLRNSDVLYTGLFFATLAWIYNGYIFGYQNHGQEIPPILAMIDPALYKADFAVQDFILPGTRYAYYSLVAWISTFFNINVDSALLILKVFTQLSFYIALAFIFKESAKNISKVDFRYEKRNILLYGLLATVCTLPLLSWGSVIFDPNMVPSTLAMSLAIWSLYYAIHERWVLAFVFSAVATQFQFLVGFYSALVLIPALVISALRNKSIIVFLIPSGIILGSALSVYAVTLINDQQVPESFNFMEVFGRFRVPHHWLPSTGRWFRWVSDLMLLMGGTISGILLWKENEKSRNLLLLFFGMIWVTIIGVALNFLFVEIIPYTLIGKLQFQRIIPFGHLAIYLIVITNLYNTLNANVRHLSLKTTTLSITSCTLLIPSILILPFLVWFPNFNFFKTLVFTVIIIIFGFMRKYNRFILTAMILAILFILNSSILRHLPEPINKLSSQYQPFNRGQWGGNEISNWLLNNSPVDTLIIIPPDPNPVGNYLAMHSKRSVFYSFKNVPYSNYGVWQWSNRFRILLDVDIDHNLKSKDLRKIWGSRTESEITEIAEHYGACFLVDRLVDRSNLDLELIATSWVTGDEQWGLWRFNHCSNNLD